MHQNKRRSSVDRAAKRSSSRRRTVGGSGCAGSALRSAGGSIAAEKRGSVVAAKQSSSVVSAKGNLPSVLLSPVNANSRAPHFSVVDVNLSDELGIVEWVEQVRDMCNLSAAGLAGTEERMRGPICLFPFLWVGDAGCAKDIEGLKTFSITAVVNVAGVDFQSVKYPSNWDCLQVDLCSEFESAYHQKATLLGDHFRAIFVFMQRCVDSGRNVLVHCMTGKNRSVTVCTAFLMLWFRWSLPKALDHVLHRRPCAFDSDALQEELVALARVNDLLLDDESVSKKLGQAEAPAAHIWCLASGGSDSKASPVIQDRGLIVEALLSLCSEKLDGSELDTDLAALEDKRSGAITYDKFKRWFMVGKAMAG